MQKMFSLIVIVIAMGLSHAAFAATAYSGTGQTRGFTSKTGFVKERTNNENHMDGAAESSDDDEDKLDEKDDAEKDQGDTQPNENESK